MTGPVLKVAALAVMGAVCALLVRRGSGEIALLLALGVCLAGMTTALALLQPVLEMLERARSLTGLSSAFFAPVLKCVGLALSTRVAADICKDAGQGAMASVAELCGAVGALYCALPLLGTLLDTLETML